VSDNSEEKNLNNESLNNDKPNLVLALLMILLAFIFGFYLRLEILDVVVVNGWVARDFDRAFNILEGHYFPLAGPEVNNGGRLPGPFMYIFLTIPLLFHKSYESIFIFNLILNLGSIIGLFFVLKRFFNTYFACLAASLVSLNIFHIGAVQFPINPSFLFPFVVLFLWFIFELFLNKKKNFFLLSILAICLAIQFHYSFATYILVLIILCVTFKKKIPKNILLRSLPILIVCFSPYFFYKAQTFIPVNQGISKTITKPNVSALVELAKVVTLQNSIPNIIAPVRYRNSSSPPDALKNFYYLITTVSLIFLAFRLLVGRKLGLNVSFEKEIILFIFFYAPGIAYELANPKTGHYWYAFIFVIPQTLIIAYFFASIFESLTKKIVRFSFSTGLFAGFCFLAIAANNFIFEGMKKLQTTLDNGSYKTSKLFLSSLSKELNLTSQQFLEQVYFLNFRPSSFRRVLLAIGDKNSLKNSNDGTKKFCYFISEPSSNKEQVRQLVQKKFFEDRTINRFPSKIFSLKISETSKNFIITKYIPKHNQSCYNNQFSPFVVTDNIRNLLIRAKSISLNSRQSVQYKTISFKDRYDANNELISFNGSYIINSPITQTPFQFNISVEKKEDGYSLKGEIISYYYWASPDFNLNKLSVILSRGSKVNLKAIDINQYEILSEKTLASELNQLSNSNYWNYNRRWYRTFDFKLNYKLKKNDINIGIIWSVLWNNSKKTNFSKYSEDNMVTLLPEIKDWGN
jgi:hypothetical protein